MKTCFALLTVPCALLACSADSDDSGAGGSPAVQLVDLDQTAADAQAQADVIAQLPDVAVAPPDGPPTPDPQ